MSTANTDDLYKNGRPSKKQRIMWSVKYMLPWCVKVFFTKEVYLETLRLFRTHQFTISRFAQIVRAIAPTRRNIKHFSKQIQSIDTHASDRIYIYSYWMNSNVVHVCQMLKLQSSQVKKVVARAHGYDLYAERRTCKYIPLQENILEHIDVLSLISHDGLRYISEKFPNYEDKYKLSYLGTKDYGIGPFNGLDEFHLVTCSYVIPVKRVHRIVEVLSSITDRKIHWTHFGAGQDFELLKQLAREKLDTQKNITYELKGQILNQDLMVYYKNNSVSLFVNVSESEGLPVSVMEAISFGIPVVATDVGGTGEAIIDGKNGYLLNPDFSNVELVETIRKIICLDEKEYLAMRTAARKLWETSFSEKTNYGSFVQDNFPSEDR